MKIKKMPVGMYAANCYILIEEESKVGCIVDPGGDADFIMGEVKKSNIDIKFILLTHGHIDHVGAVSTIKDKLNIPVYISKEDKELMKKNQMVFGEMWNETTDDKEIKDGYILELGNLKIKCIATPGHTPGGMCFLVENVVFTGDTLFYGSIGRTDFPGGNHRQLISSIKNKLMVLKDDIVVLPGHERDSIIKFEREHNPFL
ncbi:putative metallo-hydrolase [Clostridium homopropionicum DSM 5847]|uniref:Putative metallo-hydrolase n=1 Tax=Clostridium homopropionicum DSM 5847 TaxID=1121318 RepID=A0A0L6ZDN2_9CLOT|nr:MBL fold metallo-hydrolase [Clostridium homopropionicum]KOA21075.1 putative metallo-hydrolase [Clostridium homopropionicum DSM 5847]SFF97880.1 Glyoxylase, beta-lactamase superfamily II [Clostridium homopropionicum]